MTPGLGQGETVHPLRSRLAQQGGAGAEGGPRGDHVVHQHYPLPRQAGPGQQGIRPLGIGPAGGGFLQLGLGGGVPLLDRKSVV